MIKTLQKKFILTAMAAISVLLVFLLGALNLVNILITRREIRQTLQLIAENEGQAQRPLPTEKPDAAPGGEAPEQFAGGAKNAYDTVMGSNFFVVRLDDAGLVTSTDVSRTSSVSEADAAAMAQKASETQNQTGTMGKYRYMLTRSAQSAGICAVFLDISSEVSSNLRVLALSAGIGILCWGAMLLLVFLLSKRAIRPIAENIAQQKQFVTNAGHEIKTPLAIIQSNTEAMELYLGENKWSKNIKAQTLRLSGLMQNLLTLACLEETHAPAQAVEFSLSQLLQTCSDAFLQPIEDKQITFIREIAPDISFCADQQQISQLCSILLDNASKYTNFGGMIHLTLKKAKRGGVLTLENTCDCLAPVAAETLFDRFYRSDSARTQKRGGYGIGLSVAKSIAQANGAVLSACYPSSTSIRFTLQF